MHIILSLPKSCHAHIIIVLYDKWIRSKVFVPDSEARSRRIKCVKLILQKSCTRHVEDCDLIILFILQWCIYILYETRSCVGRPWWRTTANNYYDNIIYIYIYSVCVYVCNTYIFVSSTDGIGSLARLLNRFSRG